MINYILFFFGHLNCCPYGQETFTKNVWFFLQELVPLLYNFKMALELGRVDEQNHLELAFMNRGI